MKLIRKSFRRLKQAENFQNKLYEIYDHVRLVTFPPFGEIGTYRWEVSNPKKS